MRRSTFLIGLSLALTCAGCPKDGKTAAKTTGAKAAARTTASSQPAGKTAGTPPEGKTAVDIEPKKTGPTKPAPKQTEVPLEDPEGK